MVFPYEIVRYIGDLTKSVPMFVGGDFFIDSRENGMYNRGVVSEKAHQGCGFNQNNGRYTR